MFIMLLLASKPITAQDYLQTTDNIIEAESKVLRAYKNILKSLKRSDYEKSLKYVLTKPFLNTYST